jgi:hypothetical protein
LAFLLSPEPPCSAALCTGLQLEHYALQDLLLVQDGALIYKADVSSSLMEVILHGFLEPAGRGEAAVSRLSFKGKRHRGCYYN